jgi:hypothetical protein
MKQLIWNNWNFMRFIRLGLGIAIIIQAAIVKDVLMAVLGILLTAMAVFNMGCCGTGGCSTPVKKATGTSKDISATGTSKDISYEEVD